MNDINNLLKELDVYTKKTEELVLTESILEKINVMGRFKELQRRLSSAAFLGGEEIDPVSQKMFDDVIKVKITDAYRIVTYPNIHNDVKYGITANIMFDYVIGKIKSLTDTDEVLDSRELNEEAIAFTLKSLTGIAKFKRLTVQEFKNQYKTHVFGSIQKVQMVPRTRELVNLAKKTPFILNYIDNRLIYKHIKSMNEYANIVNADFNRLLKSKPEYKDIINSYITCIETAISNSLKIYRIIRDVMIELDLEYKHIFRQILSRNVSNISESAFVKDFASDISVLCETINAVPRPDNLVSNFFKSYDINDRVDFLQTKINNYSLKIDAALNNLCTISTKMVRDSELPGFMSNVFMIEIPGKLTIRPRESANGLQINVEAISDIPKQITSYMNELSVQAANNAVSYIKNIIKSEEACPNIGAQDAITVVTTIISVIGQLKDIITEIKNKLITLIDSGDVNKINQLSVIFIPIVAVIESLTNIGCRFNMFNNTVTQ